ncbi:MAG TPA: 2-C-methyl-D-erythritol 4-phosphate cytidylyltransferase [Planctomycetota bacterium]|nr:2-C-methyl-D-erythritol 4-phosphate cytidylyltransferase [Planctomycetota bacterium]
MELKLTGPFSAVVCAAGASSRMGGKVRKPYLSLRGKPILAWSLEAIAHVVQVRQLILVTRPEDRAMALECATKAKLPRRVRIDTADGGARRQDSVFNGLKETSPSAELVLIHDAARPFPERSALVQVCQRAAEVGGAILACRVRDTIKKEAGARAGRMPAVQIIETTVPRAGLWQAQTPQVFRRELILECFENLAASAPDKEMTDDAAILEYFGKPVALVESSSMNFKVTQPEDLAIAEALLKAGIVS